MESATLFERNSDISAAHVQQAIVSRATFRAFLDRTAAVSEPEDGGPKVLMACAALSTCDWLDGDLRIEIEGDENRTRIGLLIDAAFRERIFPAVELNVPFDEFVRAVRLAPHLITPLVVRDNRAGRLVLTHQARADRPPARLEAVRDDVHTKPTVVRMTAVRPEALPDSGRGSDGGTET
jgi:hypothetical protein